MFDIYIAQGFHEGRLYFSSSYLQNFGLSQIPVHSVLIFVVSIYEESVHLSLANVNLMFMRYLIARSEMNIFFLRLSEDNEKFAII